MLTVGDKERIEELEAKAYFEWGLSKEDSREFDELIVKAQVEPTRTHNIPITDKMLEILGIKPQV